MASLENKIKEWKNSGSRMCGASASAILQNLGILDIRREESYAPYKTFALYETSVPYDYDDFNRCINTVRFFGLESRIYEMRNVSERWRNIIEHWDYLVDLHDDSPYAKQRITNFLLLKSGDECGWEGL